jgi:hypothetical protein
MAEGFSVRPVAHVIGCREQPTDDYWGVRGVRAGQHLELCRTIDSMMSDETSTSGS